MIFVPRVKTSSCWFDALAKVTELMRMWNSSHKSKNAAADVVAVIDVDAVAVSIVVITWEPRTLKPTKRSNESAKLVVPMLLWCWMMTAWAVIWIK